MPAGQSVMEAEGLGLPAGSMLIHSAKLHLVRVCPMYVSLTIPEVHATVLKCNRSHRHFQAQKVLGSDHIMAI